ncbi:MAG: pyridoxamine 5'-phosphate oxidase [Hyphomicrobiales bacterium]
MNEIVDKGQTAEEGDFTTRDDPFVLFADWLSEAENSEPNDATAMSLATVDADGMPDVRMVLLKGFDERGFTFFTNLESQKGGELAVNPVAAFCLHWKSLRRQIRVRGPVSPVTDAEADEYFATRARQSRIGAWASQQSRPLESRFALEKAVAKYATKHAIGDIPRPAYWSGFRIAPLYIEFWKNGAFRLHDRIAFRRDALDGPWSKTRMYP